MIKSEMRNRSKSKESMVLKMQEIKKKKEMGASLSPVRSIIGRREFDNVVKLKDHDRRYGY